VPDEDDFAQILVLQDVDDVVNVHLETDLCASEVTTFAESSQCGSEHEVAARAQKRYDLLPEPRSVPGRVDQDEDFWFHTLRP
jgi:hypothetical protein